MQRFALASAMPLLASSARTAVAARRHSTSQSNGTAAPTNSKSSSSTSSAFAEDGRSQEEINKVLREKIERLEAQNAAQEKATPKTFEDFFRSSMAGKGKTVSSCHGGISAHPFFWHPAARFSPFRAAPAGPDGAIYYGRPFSFFGFMFNVFLWVMLCKMLIAMFAVPRASTTIVGPDGIPVTLPYYSYGNPYYNSMFTSSCGSSTGCPLALTIPPHPKEGGKNVEIQ